MWKQRIGIFKGNVDFFELDSILNKINILDSSSYHYQEAPRRELWITAKAQKCWWRLQEIECHLQSAKVIWIVSIEMKSFINIFLDFQAFESTNRCCSDGLPKPARIQQMWAPRNWNKSQLFIKNQWSLTATIGQTEWRNLFAQDHKMLGGARKQLLQIIVGQKVWEIAKRGIKSWVCCSAERRQSDAEEESRVSTKILC